MSRNTHDVPRTQTSIHLSAHNGRERENEQEKFPTAKVVKIVIASGSPDKVND